MDRTYTVDLREKAYAVEEDAALEESCLEESSLEAIVTCWLKQVSREPIANEIKHETERYGCSLPLNSSEYVGRSLWEGISDEHYEGVFLWLVRMFVNGNKELVKKMLEGE